jgi:peroxiredoxin
MNWDGRFYLKSFLAAIALMVIVVVGSSLNQKNTGTTVDHQSFPTAPKVGEEAPDFSLKDMSGKAVALSSLRGKPLIINFWATWCTPCRTEMPAMQKAYDKYKEQGLAVLAVNERESEGEINAFKDQLKLNLLIVQDADGRIADKYGIRGMPSTIFVDSKGVISSISVGGPLTLDYIESQAQILGVK